MKKSTKTQIKSSGRNLIEQALDKAREHFGKIETKEYYNDEGFRKYPPMNTQGQEIKDARHNPFDLSTAQEDWRDNPPE